MPHGARACAPRQLSRVSLIRMYVFIYIAKGSSFEGFSETLGMTSEARASRTGNTDFSIARILADELPPTDADVNVRKFRRESPGCDSPRRGTRIGERANGSKERDAPPGETRRDDALLVNGERRPRGGDRDGEDATRRTDLTWLQYTRYRPPRLPRRSFAERRIKRRAGDHPRIPFSSSQLQVLEDRYRRCAYLTRNEVVEMSATLRLPQSKVRRLRGLSAFNVADDREPPGNSVLSINVDVWTVRKTKINTRINKEIKIYRMSQAYTVTPVNRHLSSFRDENSNIEMLL